MGFALIHSHRAPASPPTSWPLTPSNSQGSSASSPRASSSSSTSAGFSFAATGPSLSQSAPLPFAVPPSDRAHAPAHHPPLRSARSPSSSSSHARSNSLRSTSTRQRSDQQPLLATPPPSPKRAAHTRTASATALMPAAVSDANNEEETCPICLGLLSLRLAGEKPHVVPVCGHRLHHSCFEAVYGDVRRAKTKSGGSLGLCGVCRRDMKIGDPSDLPGKANKFAKLSGLPSASDPPPSFKMRSQTKGTLYDDDEPTISSQDDELVQLPVGPPFSPHFGGGIRASTSTGSTLTSNGSTRRGSGGTWGPDGGSTGSGSRGASGLPPAPVDIVKPIVTVRAEHSSVERSYERDKKQHLTCMVSIEVPSRYPPPPRFADLHAVLPPLDHHARGTPPPPLPLGHSSTPSVRSHPRSSSPASSVYSSYVHGATGATNPFAHVVQDLQARMADWKGHSPEEFGQLKLYDTINVRKDTATREFTVYLFEEAILCVSDDRRRGLGKVLSAVSPSSSEGGADKLRLKGRVYVRHIRSVADTSRDDELSLTILMNDDSVAEFVMLFKERTSLEVWKSQVEQLLEQHASPASGFPETRASAALPRDRTSDISSSDQSRITAFSGYTRSTSTSMGPTASVIHEEDESGADEFGRFAEMNAPGYASSSAQSPPYGSTTYPRHGSIPSSPFYSAHDAARAFTPLDLMLILSVPPPGSGALKTDILKSALDFIVQHVGPRTRLSVVTYSSGEGSRAVLRKTPFIAVGKPEGKRRLEKVVQELGCEMDDLTSMIEHKEDRVNVVTACNLALDIVLQRKVKSALTGMILLNDGRDGAQKQQMDLVMARAEAANVPIHAIGWGRSHDPASLWLLSNHSAGSYTFVKDFYDLRDALAGCVGGILSIAATNVRLHIKVPEQRWFRIRKVSGTPGAIVAKTGTDVDVEIGELRYGERKDLIVEVELSLSGFEGHGPRTTGLRDGSDGATGGSSDFSSATDAFFRSQGFNPSMNEVGPSNLYEDDLYDSMPDEAPVFEVNAAYRDPAAGKSISRLTQSPCLLTITINAPSSNSRQAAPPSAPEIVRRRMELLVSDMLSRALLLMTRRNDAQAVRLLQETKRIISTISGTLVPSSSVSSPLSASTSGSSASHLLRNRTRRSSIAATTATQRTLAALAEDVDAVHEACLSRELFDTVGRYQAAQQAVVLRDQRAWTPKSATERLFWTAENSLYLVAKSQAWISANS
ncbi:VWA and PH domain-containing RING finger protein [Rhodotorula paludigena]|uniref:VWA and PH domain-containing RING finger protein n=1 Tax=Rhodotorula paludigena TaxID=86838 RepID=UPI00316BF4DE